MKSYDHGKIEKRWQKEWDKSGIYHSEEGSGKPKAYILDMFPYPSGDGLHVGHPKGYIATDIVSRHARMQGKNVLHPMGWDAFGLPAENFAIKNKVHPRKAVEKNVARFKEQLQKIGLDYDWSREINTTDPEYYKWTQWIFLKLFEKGLAYEAYEPINWCPSCQTGLANEDLDNGVCERCGSVVEKKPMRQWTLKITEYAERLLKDLDLLPEWQEHIKESQRNWIGKSEGAEIEFPVAVDSGVTRFVILHGKHGSPERDFFPWLRTQLEKQGFEVQMPVMPNASDPDDMEQADYIEKNFTLDEGTVVVGHSYGGVVALRLAERGIKINRLHLLGTPFSGKRLDGKDGGRSFAALQRGFDFEAIKRNVRSGTLLYDINDDVIAMSDGESYARKLGWPLIKGTGKRSHFNGEVEPDVLMAITPMIRIFTTRPDTLFGATYMVIAPEHPIIHQLESSIQNLPEVAKYTKVALTKSEIERTAEGKEKTGVKLEGIMAINPANQERIPVFAADYVLAHYGTGAIMAVPAHDQRDYEFAKKFDIPMRYVIAPHTVDTKNMPRPDKKTVRRKTVHAMIRDPKTGKFLILRWKEHPWKTFVLGGVDDGEDIVEAARREAKEETGYVNLAFRKIVGGPGCTEYFAAHKDENRFSTAYAVLFDLEDTTKEPVSAEEEAKHEPEWMTLEDFANDPYLTCSELPWWMPAIDHDAAYTGSGLLIESGEFDGLTSEEAKAKMATKFGAAKTTYKLRDWVFSRQRYWGEPIPIIHCEKDGIVPVPYDQLPVKLPDVERYEPTGTGESPLANIIEWVNTACPKCAGPAKRETNTMPQWAGSSWYYLRYMDPKNDSALVDAGKEKYWAPVDVYVGGAEHATRHLIYARFWHKFLQDIGIVSTPEPFTRLISVGLIMAEDGKKMSKRYGNVINPDDIVNTYGADTLRIYEMFMGPFTDAIAWKTSSLIGARRFLERVWRLQDSFAPEPDADVERTLHQTLKKVGEDIANFKFNTAISQMMIFVNTAEKGITKEQYQSFITVLAPFAPHIADELWHVLGNEASVHVAPWPAYDESKLMTDTVTIVVQVDGKSRAEIAIPHDSSKEFAQGIAQEAAAKWLEGREVARVIFVANRLINLVLA